MSLRQDIAFELIISTQLSLDQIFRRVEQGEHTYNATKKQVYRLHKVLHIVRLSHGLYKASKKLKKFGRETGFRLRLPSDGLSIRAITLEDKEIFGEWLQNMEQLYVSDDEWYDKWDIKRWFIL